MRQCSPDRFCPTDAPNCLWRWFDFGCRDFWRSQSCDLAKVWSSRNDSNDSVEIVAPMNLRLYGGHNELRHLNRLVTSDEESRRFKIRERERETKIWYFLNWFKPAFKINKSNRSSLTSISVQKLRTLLKLNRSSCLTSTSVSGLKSLLFFSFWITVSVASTFLQPIMILAGFLNERPQAAYRPIPVFEPTFNKKVLGKERDSHPI